MIGFYDYTVIATYLGLASALLGIVQAISGNWLYALLCAGGALLCDTVDGRIARAKKNRTRQEVLFGIQIDSLCDLVSFGVLPAVICYTVGLQTALDLVLMAAYCLCCVIRLGYFNVLEIDRKEDQKSGYRGLPVVCFALIMPAVFLFRLWVPADAFLWILRAAMAVMGLLYVLNFRINKPKLWVILLLIPVFVAPYVVLFLNR
jgi:CDP-diacylglycerol--serine O-phosphatidyltransferase